MNTRQAFAYSLRTFRHHRKVTQEDFSEVSSRTYISQLERAQKSPTLDKVVDLAQALKVHPMSLLLLAVLKMEEGADMEALLARIRAEVEECL